jgi:hypothetical protein
MQEGAMQDAVRQLTTVVPMLTDSLDEGSIKVATDLLDQLVRPLSEDDVRALLSLLPPSGDTAFGLNWTILHAIEAAPSWPIWAALTDTDNEWMAMLLARLGKGGYVQFQSSSGS